MTTPAWQAPHNGMPGDRTALNDPGHLNQFLGAHVVTPVYAGAQIVTPGATASTFGTDFYWITPSLISGIGALINDDVSAPFTMPVGSTTVGRIQAAMQPVGNGADVRVTLYPDSGGAPSVFSPIASTVVPAAHITNLGAADGLANGGPIATQFSNILQAGPYSQYPWGTLSTSAAGLLTTTTTASYGQYMVLFGGLDSNTGNPVANVFVVPLSDTGAGPAAAAPSLPQSLYTPGVAATTDTLISAGGYTGSTYSSSVYTASWDPNTGSVSAWAAQASLPTAVQLAQVAVWNDSTVYVIGGYNGSAQSTVYIGQMSNQQITSWTSGPPLPTAAYGHIVGVFGNILVVAGGVTSPTSAAIGNTYWTTINADGTLAGWQTGPTMPVAVGQFNGNTLVTDAGLFVNGGVTQNGASPTLTKVLQSLTVTANGLGAWQQQQINGNALSLPTGGFANGDGSWTLVGLGTSTTGFTTVQTLYPVPFISVPLPATGLTPGATYHVVFHQIGGDLNDYVQLGQIASSSAEWLYSTRFSGAPWIARGGIAILANVFDQTDAVPIVHLWQDPDSYNLAASTATLLRESHGLLIGACESTAFSQGPLNSNSTFTSGVSPWTAHGGTFVQSAAQTHGGYPFSGLLTPDGVTAEPYAVSEQMPVEVGLWYRADGWFYSTTGWSQVLIQMNWYDQHSNQVGYNFWQTGLSAGTWTRIVLDSPAYTGAAYATLQLAQAGTPPATALLYASNFTMRTYDPVTLASVASVNYNAGSPRPPIGVTQLN